VPSAGGHQTSDRLPITDGLRALAIIAVVVFHTFPAVAPGGFIGVDVFFVVSGFVISLRYLDGLADKSVKFSEFYARRIQRLVPAYFALVVIVTLLSYLILRPNDLLNFGRSLAAQTFYLQNVEFWIEGEYFDSALHKPLLHTWSLAVEEQFYLLFPLFVLVFRRSRRTALWVLGGAFAISLLLGFFIGPISPKTSFYLLPTRIWEFAAGIAAMLAYRKQLRVPGTDLLFAASVVAIVVASIVFGPNSNFPGLQSLLAVMATALICIVQRSPSPVLADSLTNRFSQHIGRISYSWYLWHWPVVSLPVLYLGRDLTIPESFLALIVGYLLAVLSYELLERPALRSVRLREFRTGAVLLCAFLATAFIGGSYLVITRGALDRYPPWRASLYAAAMDRPPYRCPFLARLEMYDAQVCELFGGSSGRSILLLGDSHADAMKPALERLASETGTSLFMTKQNCRAVDFGIDRNCPPAVWKQIKKDVRKLKIGKIIVISRYVPSLDINRFIAGVNRVEEAGVPVIWQMMIPSGPYFDPNRAAEGTQPKPYTRQQYIRDYRQQTEALERLSAHYGGRLTIVSPLDAICPDETKPCNFATAGKPNFSDEHHVTAVGAAQVIPLYRPFFQH